MDSYRAIDCYTESCKLLIQHLVHLQSKHKTSRNQKRKQVITEVLLSATFCRLQPERRGQLQGIKAPFTGCKVPSAQLLLEPHLIQRPCWPITPLNMLEAVGRGLFKRVPPAAASFCFLAVWNLLFWCGQTGGYPCHHLCSWHQVVQFELPGRPQVQWYPSRTVTGTHCTKAAEAVPSCGCD